MKLNPKNRSIYIGPDPKNPFPAVHPGDLLKRVGESTEYGLMKGKCYKVKDTSPNGYHFNLEETEESHPPTYLTPWRFKVCKNWKIERYQSCQSYRFLELKCPPGYKVDTEKLMNQSQPIPGLDVKGNPIGEGDIVKIITGPWLNDTGRVIEKTDGGSLIAVSVNDQGRRQFFPWEIEVIRQAPGGMGAFRPMALPISGQPEPVEKQVERVNTLIKTFHETNKSKVVWNMSTTQFEVIKPHLHKFWALIGQSDVESSIQGDKFNIGCQHFNTEFARRALIRLLKDNESEATVCGGIKIHATKAGIKYDNHNQLISWAAAENILKELDDYVSKK